MMILFAVTGAILWLSVPTLCPHHGLPEMPSRQFIINHQCRPDLTLIIIHSRALCCLNIISMLIADSSAMLAKHTR